MTSILSQVPVHLMPPRASTEPGSSFDELRAKKTTFFKAQTVQAEYMPPCGRGVCLDLALLELEKRMGIAADSAGVRPKQPEKKPEKVEKVRWT
mmetsp:Transcript_12433/g.28486  ORF Transcript_12433/g.28486 Transcript_12433/m.28486 type:complete len:94 (-) Transcript_12433:236-517(-)